VNITLKSKIRYNGQEYSHPNQLPPEVRAAYQEAMRRGSFRKKIVINGQEVTDQDEAARTLCDDVMSVIENNGEVTLPSNIRSSPLITKRQILLVIIFALGIASLILLRLAD
jgi:hypothetical protein